MWYIDEKMNYFFFKFNNMKKCVKVKIGVGKCVNYKIILEID